MIDSSSTPVVEEIARECLAVRLRRLNRMITRIYDSALRPHGVKVSQLNVLVVAGKKGTVRPAEVAEILEIEVSTLSRNLERMRARGWLVEVAEPDARTRPFKLTAKGRKMLNDLAPAWEAAQREAAELIGRDGVRWLHRVSGLSGAHPKTS
jgi:DNA-binding MarR family transcriptional regulator